MVNATTTTWQPCYNTAFFLVESQYHGRVFRKLLCANTSRNVYNLTLTKTVKQRNLDGFISSRYRYPFRHLPPCHTFPSSTAAKIHPPKNLTRPNPPQQCALSPNRKSQTKCSTSCSKTAALSSSTVRSLLNFRPAVGLKLSLVTSSIISSDNSMPVLGSCSYWTKRCRKLTISQRLERLIANTRI